MGRKSDNQKGASRNQSGAVKTESKDITSGAVKTDTKDIKSGAHSARKGRN